ncbi:MAG: helix-turn-helix domain-containing protein, partial [Candidatus Latescibacterota bacterium]
NESRPVDVRVIAATNRDLLADVETGKFRKDLYYRLNVMGVIIPPLRERSDDILLLAKHFLEHWNHKLGKNVVGFETPVRQAFLSYAWPGNIRELDNVIYRSVALVDDGEKIGLEYLPEAFQAGAKALTPAVPTQTLKAEMADYEKEVILVALADNHWHVTNTAEKLGISRVALGQKIKRYGIQKPNKDN